MAACENILVLNECGNVMRSKCGPGEAVGSTVSMVVASDANCADFCRDDRADQVDGRERDKAKEEDGYRDEGESRDGVCKEVKVDEEQEETEERERGGERSGGGKESAAKMMVSTGRILSIDSTSSEGRENAAVMCIEVPVRKHEREEPLLAQSHLLEETRPLRPSQDPFPAAQVGDLCIRGLAWSTTNESLHKYFSQFGEVVLCSVKMEEDGRSKGYGFVNFRDPKAISQVLGMSHFIDNRLVQVRPPRTRQPSFPITPKHRPSNATLISSPKDISTQNQRRSLSVSPSHSTLIHQDPLPQEEQEETDRSSYIPHNVLPSNSENKTISSEQPSPISTPPLHSSSPTAALSDIKPARAIMHKGVEEGIEGEMQGGGGGESVIRVEAERRRKIFVGFLLADSVKAADLREYFSQFGMVTEVFMPPHKQARGYAFVTFAAEESAQAVLETRKHTVNGVRVQVKLPNPKGRKERSPSPALRYPSPTNSVSSVSSGGSSNPFFHRAPPSVRSSFSSLSRASSAPGNLQEAKLPPSSLSATNMATMQHHLQLQAAVAQLQLQTQHLQAQLQAQAGAYHSGLAAGLALTNGLSVPPVALGGVPASMAIHAGLGSGMGMGLQPALAPGLGMLGLAGNGMIQGQVGVDYTMPMLTYPQLFVSNLHRGATQQDVTEYFMPHGHVVRVEVLKDEHGRSKGKAIVRFSNVVDASKALHATNKHTFKGRQIVVKEDIPSRS